MSAPTPIRKQAPMTSGLMTLSNISRGKVEKPFRVLVYGIEGCGKTSFAAGAPSPIFLATEDGTSHLDVHRFPAPRAWADVLEALRVLTHEKHDFKTVVIDTVDALEPLCWAHVCTMGGKAAIEDFGYGKGYVAALDHWRILLQRLDILTRTRQMHVILVGHSQVKRVDDPQAGTFDRYRLKVHERASDLLREWTDAVLFARHEVFAVEKKGRVRGVSSGARVLHTTWSAAYDAKNRFDLPDTLPLDWSAFADAARAGAPAAASALEAAVRELLPRLPEGPHPPEGPRSKAAAYLETHAADPRALAKLLDRVRAVVGADDEPKETNNAE